MKVFEVLIIAVMFYGLYLGFQRGFIKQISDLIILFFSSFIATLLKDGLFKLIYKFLPFFNFHGKTEGLKSINIILWNVILYILILVLLILIVKKILDKTKLTNKIIDSMVEVNLISKVLGILISIPLMIIFIFNILIFVLLPNFNLNTLNDSKIVNNIMENTFVLSRLNENLYNNEKYVIKRINKKDNTVDNLTIVNNDIINNMVKTNFVSVDMIKQINKKGKLLGKRKDIKLEDNIVDDPATTTNDKINPSTNDNNDQSGSQIKDDSKIEDNDNTNVKDNEDANEDDAIKSNKKEEIDFGDDIEDGEL